MRQYKVQHKKSPGKHPWKDTRGLFDKASAATTRIRVMSKKAEFVDCEFRRLRIETTVMQDNEVR